MTFDAPQAGLPVPDVTRVVDLAQPTLGTLIGLGVGIDYELFIVTRHRGNLKAGMSPGTLRPAR